MNRLEEMKANHRPAPLTPMAREAKLTGMTIAVYGPDSTDPIPGRTRCYSGHCLKRKGRMAEDDPGDYLASVLPFRTRTASHRSITYCGGSDAA